MRLIEIISLILLGPFLLRLLAPACEGRLSRERGKRVDPREDWPVAVVALRWFLLLSKKSCNQKFAFGHQYEPPWG